MEYAGTYAAQPTPAASPSFATPGGAAPAAAHPAMPADFDVEAFVRQAKVQFIRLQAANDAGDLNDIREFTSPEMFAEIRMQLADRGTATQRTDVVELNAEVIEVAEEPQRYIVSVRFSGLLRRRDWGDNTASSYPVLVCQRGALLLVNDQVRDVTARCIDDFVTFNQQANTLQRF